MIKPLFSAILLPIAAFLLCSQSLAAQGTAKPAEPAPDSTFTLPSVFGFWFTNGQKESRDCGSYSFIGLGTHVRVSLLGDPKRVELLARGAAYLDKEVKLSYDIALGAGFAERFQVLAGYSWPSIEVCGEGERAGETIGNRGGFMLGAAYGITGLYAELNHVWYTLPAVFSADNPQTERSATGFAFRLGYALVL